MCQIKHSKSHVIARAKFVSFNNLYSYSQSADEG